MGTTSVHICRARICLYTKNYGWGFALVMSRPLVTEAVEVLRSPPDLLQTARGGLVEPVSQGSVQLSDWRRGCNYPECNILWRMVLV